MPKETPKTPPRFPVFHVPHDGSLVSEHIGMFCVPEEQVRYYHEQMRDKDVQELIPPEYHNPESTVWFPVSRLQCDVERFRGPEEIMEKYGMGISYAKAYDGTVINQHPYTNQEIQCWYESHHSLMNHRCCAHKQIILIDLHSYHDEIVLPDFLIPGRKTPDLCIGTDPRFTPSKLLRVVRKRFEDEGLTTDVNYPYAGCYIPERIAEWPYNCNLFGIMLEFHRRAYLNEEGKTDPQKRNRIRNIIRQIIEDMAADVEQTKKDEKRSAGKDKI